jgi:hypothetical protein
MTTGGIGNTSATSALPAVRALRSSAIPVAPITPIDAPANATETSAIGRINVDPASLLAPQLRGDQIVAREGAAAPIDLTVALERARAGLATLDPAAILDALDPVWSMESAPPSAWYLRAAALSFVDAATEAEGVTLLGLQRWPEADALEFAKAIVLLHRGATEEAVRVFTALRARNPQGPWDAVTRALVPDPSQATPTGELSVTASPRLAARAPTASVRALAQAVLDAPSGELAEYAMSLARTTSLGAESVGDRHGMRKLVAAVFAVLSREGGGSSSVGPDGAVDAVVRAVRERALPEARRIVERLPPSPAREIAAQLVDAAETHNADVARAEDRPDAPLPLRSEVATPAPDRTLPPSLLLWRDGMRLLDAPEEEVNRVRRRLGGRGDRDARSGWSPLPQPERRIPVLPSARWGAIVAVLVVIATLSRCVVR